LGPWKKTGESLFTSSFFPLSAQIKGGGPFWQALTVPEGNSKEKGVRWLAKARI
jgi:hypothetical protein